VRCSFLTLTDSDPLIQIFALSVPFSMRAAPKLLIMSPGPRRSRTASWLVVPHKCLYTEPSLKVEERGFPTQSCLMSTKTPIYLLRLVSFECVFVRRVAAESKPLDMPAMNLIPNSFTRIKRIQAAEPVSSGPSVMSLTSWLASTLKLAKLGKNRSRLGGFLRCDRKGMNVGSF